MKKKIFISIIVLGITIILVVVGIFVALMLKNEKKEENGKLTSIKQVFMDDSFTALLTDDGKIYTSGKNQYGQLGLGDTNDRTSFTLVETDAIFEEIIFPGSDSMMIYGSMYALTSDGHLYAWGNNDHGQLGLGDTNNRTTPTLVSSNLRFKAMTGGMSAFGISMDGKLYSWGFNGDGQLGLGDKNDRTTPTLVSNDLVFKKVVGQNSVLGLTKDGKLYSWGSNHYGQLGLGDINDRTTPTLVSNLLLFSDMSLQGKYAMALTNDGKIYTSGDNKYGQLGLGDIKNRIEFTMVPSDLVFSSIHIGGSTSYAITKTGDLYSCGNNHYGIAGNGKTTADNSFVKIESNIATINGGLLYVGAIKTNGDLYTWGQLDIGAVEGKLSPTLVPNIKNAKQIETDGFTTIALTTDGLVYGWGLNKNGELGLGHKDIVNGPTQLINKSL